MPYFTTEEVKHLYETNSDVREYTDKYSKSTGLTLEEVAQQKLYQEVINTYAVKAKTTKNKEE